MSLTARYETTLELADPYRFSLTNYATATVTTESPLSVDDWAREWINPLVALVTLATGEQEELDTVALAAAHPTSDTRSRPAPADITGELWGAGIHQRDRPAERRTRRDGSPLVPLFTLDSAPPLAELLRTWRTDLAEETAVSLYRLAIDPTLPSHVQYLLCAQALEALDTTTRRAVEEQEDIEHEGRREAALAAIATMSDDDLDGGTQRFIRDNLGRRPYRSLAGRLHRLIARVPSADERSHIWEQRTRSLATELDALGRISWPLHERLASARNALSHGTALSPTAIDPATGILQSLLRGQLLQRLAFDDDQISTAYDRMMPRE